MSQVHVWQLALMRGLFGRAPRHLLTAALKRHGPVGGVCVEESCRNGRLRCGVQGFRFEVRSTLIPNPHHDSQPAIVLRGSHCRCANLYPIQRRFARRKSNRADMIMMCRVVRHGGTSGYLRSATCATGQRRHDALASLHLLYSPGSCCVPIALLVRDLQGPPDAQSTGLAILAHITM